MGRYAIGRSEVEGSEVHSICMDRRASSSVS